MSILRPLEIIIAHGPELAAAGLDPHEFALAVGGFPKTRILLLDPALPEEEQQDRLRRFLGKGHRRPVVIASTDPESRAAATLRILRRTFQCNPERLSVVDLQPALEQRDKKSRRLKGLELIRLAAAHVTRAFPIHPEEVPVSTRVLVWGDSFAALKAAQELAASGYPVTLAGPKPELHPLDPEVPHLPVSAGLAALVGEVLSTDNIRVLTEVSLLAVEGAAGNFTVRLELAREVLEETAGAVILAPELEIDSHHQAFGLPAHPRLISLTEVERLLEKGEPTSFAPEEGGTVALLAGFSPESSPPGLRRVLAAAAQLLKQANLQVYLFLGQARVAAPGLEAALEAAQENGLIVFKLPDMPEIAPADGGTGLTVSFVEPVLRRPVKLSVEAAGLEEIYCAAAANAALAKVLEIPLNPRGFLQGDNVHLTPVATWRRGIYSAGPGRGVMGLDQALMDVEAAVAEVQKLLGQGAAHVPQGRAVVDRGLCVLCLTCYRVCPHRAITYDNRARIEEIACQGCGTCASECPQEAIQIRNYTDDQVTALFESFDPQLSPRIVAFLCRNSAWEAYQAALKLKHADIPPGLTAIKMPCAGKIDVDYLLRAVVYGSKAVMVLACHPDNCKSRHGNEFARWRVEQVQTYLAEVGLDPQRVLFKSLAANAPQDFLDAVAEMEARLGAMSGAPPKAAVR
ncbi:MAG: hydrogenase iron-sulfur subunit [Deltaproteobacteria bacterium]|nr:hydrogenase iron-sulfur subunit [Deltaproteobacteria bacterium]